MSKVYVFGPIHLFGKDYLLFYKAVMKLCGEFFDQVIGTYPDFWNSKETPKKFYNRTYETITDSDLFIAEVSSPSLGVGMELQMAVERKIPVIAVAKKGIEISTMVIGLPNLFKVIHYISIQDFIKKLKKELKSFGEKV